MIAESYICIVGTCPGEILWIEGKEADSYAGQWQPYADFEREKLKELHGFFDIRLYPSGRTISLNRSFLDGKADNGPSSIQEAIPIDTESQLIQQRADLLKRACKMVGVEWLPKSEQQCQMCCPPRVSDPCPCKCHKIEERCGRVETVKMTGPTSFTGPDGTEVRFRYCKPEQPKRCDPGQDCKRSCLFSDIYCPCSCHKPERDYYTKDEIDQKFKGVVKITGEATDTYTFALTQ